MRLRQQRNKLISSQLLILFVNYVRRRSSWMCSATRPSMRLCSTRCCQPTRNAVSSALCPFRYPVDYLCQLCGSALVVMWIWIRIMGDLRIQEIKNRRKFARKEPKTWRSLKPIFKFKIYFIILNSIKTKKKISYTGFIFPS